MRGGAVVILAALVGAWALGLAEAGGKEKSPAPNVVKPNDPEDSRTYDIRRSRAVEKAEGPRTKKPDPSDAAVNEPVVNTSEEPVDDGDTTPTGTDPTAPAEPDPSLDPDPGPGPSPTPPPPTNPPTQPEQECTDLASVVDCVLDPVTSQP